MDSQPPPLPRRSSYQAQHDMLAAESTAAGNASSQYDSQASSSLRDSDDAPPVVKSTDMPDVMQAAAIALAQRARAQAREEGAKKDFHNIVARIIKKEFDTQYGGCWHCVVGRNFGSLVTHTSRTFIYFYTGPVAVLLFKSGSQAL